MTTEMTKVATSIATEIDSSSAVRFSREINRLRRAKPNGTRIGEASGQERRGRGSTRNLLTFRLVKMSIPLSFSPLSGPGHALLPSNYHSVGSKFASFIIFESKLQPN